MTPADGISRSDRRSHGSAPQPALQQRLLPGTLGQTPLRALVGLCIALWVAAPGLGLAQDSLPLTAGRLERVADPMASIRPDTRRPGYDFMSPSTQALQSDRARNPAMLWVREGERLWREPIRPSGERCQDCHGDPQSSMRGVSARYPAWDETLGRPVNLMHRIKLCRERHQSATDIPAESDDLLSLEALIADQSRASAIEPVNDARLQPALAEGRSLYATRIGQLALSCTDCHDRNAGARLGGSPIPQAHPTAYPIYRLQWQALGSLTRRLRGCFSGVRAEAPDPFAPAMTALELFLRDRAAGMAHEGPGIRP